MRILITGGAGFIGSALSKRLLREGNEIWCLDNLSTGHMENITDLMDNPQFHFMHRDVTDPVDISVEQIYNLACPASPEHYQKEPVQTAKTCFLGALHTLELARKYNATILQTSTSEIYGDPLVHPQTEDYKGNVNPIGIRSCYEVSVPVMTKESVLPKPYSLTMRGNMEQISAWSVSLIPMALIWLPMMGEWFPILSFRP